MEAAATTLSEEEVVCSMDRPLLDNIIAPLECIGLAPLLNPLYNHVSSQRLMMLSTHIVQALIVTGAEFPALFSGIEGILGEYENDPTRRDQDVEILAAIPRFAAAAGTVGAGQNSPYYTIIYRGDKDNLIHYFNYNTDTFRSEGYGYINKQIGWNKLTPGTILPKDVKLQTSPAHEGNMYKLGANINACCLELPHVTEDAFIISETAARKYTTYGYGKLNFRIAANQIPLDLYGDETEYKFMPDIGETVHKDGILCALRTPTENSIIYDTSPENLTRVQHLHDSKIYVPAGAVIVDTDIVVNRKCKSTLPANILAQVKKYRDPINQYCARIVEVYNKAIAEGREVSKEFNNLVTRCMESLLIDGQSVEGLNRKYSLKAYRCKDPIEFINISILYRYECKIHRGSKFTNRAGGKGTVAAIWKDEDMPTDEYGIHADIIKAGVSVVNRMNPSQWYEIFTNRGAELLKRRVIEDLKLDNSMAAYIKAFDLFADYAHDCNPHWGEIICSDHPTPEKKREFVEDVIKSYLYIWMPPGIKNIDPYWVKRMADKWHIDKTPVTFTIEDQNHARRTITTKKKVMIGPEYFYLLYKIPHLRCCNIGHISQNRSPVRPNAQAKMEYPFSQAAIRFGEDEMRNLVMTSGAETAAYILGVYANSFDAVMTLGRHLLRDKVPSQLESVGMSLSDIIKSNNIVTLARYIFSCLGVNITPTEAEVASLLSDQDAVAAAEEVEDKNAEKISDD